MATRTATKKRAVASRPKLGKKMRNMKEMRKALKNKAGGLTQRPPKDGALTVRFSEEPEGNWVKYEQHWDQGESTSFPCIGEDYGCVGCEEKMRKSERFLANAIDVDQKKPIVVELPKTLANLLVKYYEKYGTLLDRDYELSRDGSGTDTEYFAAPEGKTKITLSKYDLSDLDDVLEKMADAYFDAVGEEAEDEEEDDDDRPARKTKTKARKRSSAAPSRRSRDDDDDDDEEEDEDDEDDEDEDERPARKAKPKAKAKKAPAPRRRKPADDDDEDDDDEEEDEEDEEEDEEDEEDEDEDDEDEDEDGEFWDEAELKGKSVGELRIIAKDYDIKTTGLKKADLIKAILEDD